MTPPPPSILLTALSVFSTLLTKNTTKRVLFSISRAIIVIVISGCSTLVTLNITLGINQNIIGLLGGVITLSKTLDIVFQLSKKISTYKILSLKYSSIIRNINSKISEWNEYYSGVTEISENVPEKFSSKELFDYITSFYKEIDDIELNHLTGDSYNTILLNSE